jgi:hypothetical protein
MITRGPRTCTFRGLSLVYLHTMNRGKPPMMSGDIMLPVECLIMLRCVALKSESVPVMVVRVVLCFGTRQ